MSDTKVKAPTKRENFETLKGIVVRYFEGSGDTAECDRLVAALDHEIDLLNRKRAKSDTPTKAQLANEAVKADICAVLEHSDAPMRSSDIGKTLDLNVQKVTAMLKQLVEAGVVVRIEDKKVTTFDLA